MKPVLVQVLAQVGLFLDVDSRPWYVIRYELPKLCAIAISQGNSREQTDGAPKSLADSDAEMFDPSWRGLTMNTSYADKPVIVHYITR